MITGGKKSMAGLLLSALLASTLALTVPAAAQNAPRTDARNMELVGASQYQG